MTTKRKLTSEEFKHIEFDTIKSFDEYDEKRWSKWVWEGIDDEYAQNLITKAQNFISKIYDISELDYITNRSYIYIK
jgi:chemotaxis regulatin CheY-phosphate phosphatase CheZ